MLELNENSRQVHHAENKLSELGIAWAVEVQELA